MNHFQKFTYAKYYIKYLKYQNAWTNHLHNLFIIYEVIIEKCHTQGKHYIN